MDISRHLLDRQCPVCGSQDKSQVAYPARIDEDKLDDFAFASRKLPEYMHMQLLKCPTCGVLYACPALAPEFLAHAYRDASYDSDEEAEYAAETYARQLKSLLGLIGDRGVALEIGAGNGAFLRHLREAGFREVIGVEPSYQAAARADEAIRPFIRPGMFQASNFAPGSISLLSCFQTIEHVSDPRGLCADAYELLRPDGAIFLIGHDYRSWVTRLFGEKSPIFDIEHLQLFSQDSLRFLLNACGFEDIRVGTIRNRYPLAYWMKLLPAPARVKRALIPLSRKLLVGRLPLSVNIGNLYAVGFKRCK
ncbi:MAG: class I SAM-dependent methyltransferase [Bryobacteraceae bacterium]|jgi:SAM-dependent methyltransferase